MPNNTVRRVKVLARQLRVSPRLLKRAALFEFAQLEPDFQLDILQRFLQRQQQVRPSKPKGNSS